VSTFSYHGVIPILPTPFLDDERIDIESMLRLVEFLATIGITAVTILGVLGEANTLTDCEADELVREVVAADLGVAVVVGASRPGVRGTVAVAEMAATAGAAAVMVTPPGIDGMTEQAVHTFFAGVAARTPLPLVVQDHPASSRVQLPTRLAIRLIDELEQVCGLKCETVPTAPKIRAIKAATTRVPILTGLGALYAALDLAAGSDGFNTGFAFPEVLLALVASAGRADTDDITSTYRRFLPLIVMEQQPGPALRKEIWRLRGLLTTARVRAPGAQLDPWAAARLAESIADCFPAGDITKSINVAWPR
jgi:4-hydroxy-tetrahydrodipicolinate synthase